MRRVIFFLTIATVVHPSFPDLFTDLLVPPKKDAAVMAAYYQLIPAYDEDNPDLWFIKSRKAQAISLEEPFLRMVEEAFQTPMFIETGTYQGDTTALAATIFPHVYSIELSRELFEKARKRFAKNEQIHLYEGDSVKLLPYLLKLSKERMMLFLDAHFSMGSTVKGEVNTPILSELTILKESKIADAIILIDDTRMFYEPINCVEKTFIEGYPTLNEIVCKLQDINPHYQCALIYDVLIAFPADQKIVVSPLVRALTMSRLYDGHNYEMEDVLKAELFIAYAQGEEKESLLELAQAWVEPWSATAGLSRHYALWTGLIMLAQEQYDKGLAYLQEAKKRGLSDWRIDWYIAMAQAQCFFAIR